jgi:hypothetical protein
MSIYNKVLVKDEFTKAEVLKDVVLPIPEWNINDTIMFLNHVGEKEMAIVDGYSIAVLNNSVISGKLDIEYEVIYYTSKGDIKDTDVLAGWETV